MHVANYLQYCRLSNFFMFGRQRTSTLQTHVRQRYSERLKPQKTDPSESQSYKDGISWFFLLEGNVCCFKAVVFTRKVSKLVFSPTLIPFRHSVPQSCTTLWNGYINHWISYSRSTASPGFSWLLSISISLNFLKFDMLP